MQSNSINRPSCSSVRPFDCRSICQSIHPLEELSVCFMEMEVDSIEIRIYEMMELEDWAGEDDKEWIVDRDGDQVMPQVELKIVTEESDKMTLC